MQAAARHSYQWVKEWVPRDLVIAGGPCVLYKWVREDRLSALKAKDKEQGGLGGRGVEATKAKPTTEVLFLCNYDGCGKTFVDAGSGRAV